MSLTPSSLLARLEELKKWQAKQQERLIQQQLSRTNPTDASSNYDTIEGLSQFDSSLETTRRNQSKATTFSDQNLNRIKENSHTVEYDNANPLSKPYNTSRSVLNGRAADQSSNGIKKRNPLVEYNEIIRENENMQGRPKKTFLKRGSGLVRFKMNPGDQKRPFNKIIKRRSNLKGKSDEVVSQECDVVEITPLKRPDINIKAVWFKVDDEGGDSNRKDTDVCDVEHLAKKTILQINELAAQTLNTETETSNPSCSNNIKENFMVPPMINEDPTRFAQTQNDPIHINPQTIDAVHSEQSLYEQQLERELLIFEALEEKALNSSFSSTNSSVLHILSSTPSKIKCRNLAKNFIHKYSDKQNHKTDNVIEEIEDEIFQEKLNSLESSVTSEDFQEKPEDLGCKDDTVWSDVNTIVYTRENSSLSSISMRSKNSHPEDIVVSHSESKDKEVDETKRVLAKKLKELDVEIQNFREENAKIQRVKLELEKQEREFKKEKKAFEKYVLEEKINVEFYLEDEKKKLTKEKMIFERYVKDVQNKTSRKEREEIASLKEEIVNLKEASKLKETRNATSQARLRNQIKSFEKEISNLREELENLRKRNAKLLSSQNFSKKSSETKMLHEINKNLSKLTKDAKVNEKLKKMEESVERTKALVSALDIEEEDSKRKSPGKEERKDFFYGREKNELKSKKGDDQDLCKNYEAYLKEVPKKDETENGGRTDDDDVPDGLDTNIERSYEMIFGKNAVEETQGNTTLASDKTTNETILPDGSREITYPNGNIKTISSDGNEICLKFFNGDIQETKLLEGLVRYYYAEKQCWQSTTADGTETFKFANGQIERKFKDGTNEVQFPNGIVRITKSDGSQTITYPDNTKVQIDGTGEKIIYLPNGQKEIHNKEHMRREYPDGIVKIVYPDGIQETRYANGRIRIKDRDGNLLLDSHESNT